MRPHLFLRTPLALATAMLAVTGLTSCGQMAPVDEATDRLAIETVIRDYLPELANAYATGSIIKLRELAVDKEIARVRHMSDQLMDQGKILKPELREVSFEKVSIWSYSNAAATTLEIWDVRSYALGKDDVLLSETIGQENRVLYQLKRKDEGDGWIILYRELAETFE